MSQLSKGDKHELAEINLLRVSRPKTPRLEALDSIIQSRVLGVAIGFAEWYRDWQHTGYMGSRGSILRVIGVWQLAQLWVIK